MRLVILKDPSTVAQWVATYIKKRILAFSPTPERPFVLGLPTGSSPVLVYRKLVDFHKAGELSFANVVTFNMDEYCGLPVSHPQSYHSFMYENFFKHIDINPANTNILDGNALDLQAECDRYEKKIVECGGIELFLGGIGPDGHIAFNEPGSSINSRTRVKTLAYDTVQANSRFFGGDLASVPRMALTVGVGTVMDAREVVVIITGSHKAHALSRCIEEGVSHMWTVSALQLHTRACIACDEDATLELRVRTVRYFKGIQETAEMAGNSMTGFQGQGQSESHKGSKEGTGFSSPSVLLPAGVPGGSRACLRPAPPRRACSLPPLTWLLFSPLPLSPLPQTTAQTAAALFPLLPRRPRCPFTGAPKLQPFETQSIIICPPPPLFLSLKR
jgi:glucosamine-6-phosphate deaminase